MFFSARRIKILVILVNMLGSFWVIANDTLLVDFIHLPYSIKTIASDSTGVIWITGGLGLQRFEDGQFITIDPSYEKSIISDNGQMVDIDNYSWPGPHNGHYPWYLSDCWKKNVPNTNDYVSAASAANGQVWVASGSDIFIFKIENRFTKMLEGYSTRGIYKDGDHFYAITYKGILQDGIAMADKPDFGQGHIKKIGNDLYIAWSGLMLWNTETKEKKEIYKGMDSGVFMDDYHVFNVHQIRDTIWLSTSKGLAIITQDSILRLSDSISYEDIGSFGGRFLLASSGNGILEKVGDKIVPLDLPPRIANQILYRDGKYYFATDLGILIWDGQNYEIINMQHGLSHRQVLSCLFDNAGCLWASTMSGLNRINLETRVITHYLQHIEFNKRSYLKQGSEMYFGSMNGVYRFSPEDFIGDDLPVTKPWGYGEYSLLGGGLFFMLGLLSYFRSKHVKTKNLKLKEKLLIDKEREVFLLQLEQFVFQNSIHAGVNTLSDYMDMSERSIYRKFQEYNITPGEFIRDVKLKKVIYLIEKRNYNKLKDLAAAVGYSDQYLLKLLKEKMGDKLANSLQ